MSSIYRKGRDGYFYYQTYVFNKKTGKKNKKIFHSLGTKDYDVAKKLKKKFDSKYDTKTYRNNIFFNYFKKNSQLLIAIPLTVIITYHTLNFFKKDKSDLKKNPANVSTIKKYSYLNIQDSAMTEKKIDYKDSNIINNKIIDPSLVFKKTVLPKYQIVRKEVFSSTFDQIKLYVTVDQKTDSATLKSLCDKISDEYSKYSSLIICLYSDTKIGLSIASGSVENPSVGEKIETWLAMYTHNPVEGAYFDDNPTGYLGVN